MVSITLVGDPNTLDPFEKDAYLSCKRAGEGCRELLRQVLDGLEMDLPPFLKRTPDEGPNVIFDSPAERQLQRSLVAAFLRSHGENAKRAEDVGRQLHELAKQDNEVGSELGRLREEWLDSATEDDFDGALGALIIEMAAEEVEQDAPSEYPLATAFAKQHAFDRYRSTQGTAGGVTKDSG